MKAVDRKNYVPSGWSAYDDSPQYVSPVVSDLWDAFLRAAKLSRSSSTTITRLPSPSLSSTQSSSPCRLFSSDTAPFLTPIRRIGFNATISAPHMHAKACENLLDHLLIADRVHGAVLDVGSGSGYREHAAKDAREMLTQTRHSIRS